MTKALLGLVLVLLSLMLLPVLGTVIGSFIGAVVGFFYPNTFAAVFTALGLQAVAALPLWQVGAFLGFVGGFFKATFQEHRPE